MSFDVEAMRHASMTHTQMLMWMGQMLSGRRPVYNMGFSISIDGDLDPDLFREAYDYVVSRSDILRSVYQHVDGGPRRTVLDFDQFEYDVPVVDFTANPDEAPEWMQSRLQEYIDIRKRLFDSALLRIAPGKTVWFIRQHHLVCDGWSIGNFIKQVGARYAQLEQGTDEGVDVPQASDVQRSREILQELRRRLGDRELPGYERDYLERLMDFF